MEELEQQFYVAHGLTVAKTSSPKQQAFLKRLIELNRPGEDPFDVVTSIITTEARRIEDLKTNEITRLIRSLDPKPSPIYVKDLPIVSNGMFEIGFQPKSQGVLPILYVKFYELLCMDVDAPSIEPIRAKLDVYKDLLTFKIYRTTNGHHLYCVSRPVMFNDRLCHKLQTAFGCDERYVRFTMYNGYKIRLSKKRQDEPFVEQYVGTYGNAAVVGDLERMVDLKDQLVKNVSERDAEPSIDSIREAVRCVPEPRFQTYQPFISFARGPIE